MRVGSRKGLGEKRKERQRGTRQEGKKDGDFSCFTMQFPKVILHIDYCFGIHDLWLTLTNNSLCLGFHWMKM